MPEPKFYVEHPSGAALLNHSLTDSKLDVDHKVSDHKVTCGDRFISDTSIQVLPIASKGEITVCFLHADILIFFK